MKIICNQCETDYPEKKHQFRSAPDFNFSKTLRMPENTDQNNSEYGHFLRIESYY